jgi:hypothetical protein
MALHRLVALVLPLLPNVGRTERSHPKKRPPINAPPKVDSVVGISSALGVVADLQQLGFSLSSAMFL